MRMTILSREENLTFRNQLRDGRAYAARDAEGFHEIIFAVERIGGTLLQRVGTLKDYEHSILKLAKRIVRTSCNSWDRRMAPRGGSASDKTPHRKLQESHSRRPAQRNRSLFFLCTQGFTL